MREKLIQTSMFSIYFTLAHMTSFVVPGRTFKMGVLLPATADWPTGLLYPSRAAAVALEMLNSDSNLTALKNAGHHFTVTWADTKCDESLALKHMVVMAMDEDPVDVIIG
jgi:hypothetical protein